jgi:hypothetical protein
VATRRLYSDPRLIGHVYVGPYAVLEPELSFIVEDADGVAGYVLGAANTALFEERLERIGGRLFVHNMPTPREPTRPHGRLTNDSRRRSIARTVRRIQS